MINRIICFFFRHKPRFITYNDYPGNGVWQYGCERCDLRTSGFWLKQLGYDIDGLNRTEMRGDNGS